MKINLLIISNKKQVYNFSDFNNINSYTENNNIDRLFETEPRKNKNMIIYNYLRNNYLNNCIISNKLNKIILCRWQRLSHTFAEVTASIT